MQYQFAWLILIIIAAYLGYRMYIGFQLDLRVWIVLAIAFGVLMLLVLKKTGFLRYLLVVWFGIGLFLGEISSTIILGFIYWVIFTPVIVFLRLISNNKSSKNGWSDHNPSNNYERLY